jgi:S-adenosylmethionine synthetase
LVEVAYGIGIPHPISLYVNTYGTVSKGFTDHDLSIIVMNEFDLRTGCIIRDLQLKNPFYKKISAYGHFGRDE